MYFAYFDESGDSGLEKSPTNTFTLSALLIHDRDWLSALDQAIAFRRYLRDQFGISPRSELKAQWLIHGKGDIRAADLSFRARMSAYQACMRFQKKTGLMKVFAVCVVKDRIKKRPMDVREVAWRYAVQRLERFGAGAKDNIHVLPDEGHGEFIRKKVREMRRFHFVPSAFEDATLERPATNIVEDASDRNSRHSFFTQLADLNAYAAFRRAFPSTNFPGDVWDELGSARVTEVNRLSGGPPGVVVWPPQ